MNKRTKTPHSNNNSIKRKISRTYIKIYLLICIVMLITFFSGLWIYNGYKFSNQHNEINKELIRRIRGDNGISPQNFVQNYLLRLRQDYANFNVEEIFLYNSFNEFWVSTNQTIDNDVYFNAGKKNLVLAIFPQMSILFSKGYYVSEHIVNEDRYLFKVLVYFDVHDLMTTMNVTIGILAIVMGVGLLLFWFSARARINSMLSPIEHITNVTKRINGENLTLRIDESEAQDELYELSKTINNMMDRIQSSYNKQKRFVSDVSHELRTPVSVISGYGNMLKRWGREDDEILEESIEAIINEASTMNDLIEKLLFLARHDNESLHFDLEEADMSKLLREVVKETNLVHSEFEFEINIDDGINAKIDSNRMKQLFRILIDNALKYSYDEKVISISLSIDDKFVKFVIKDYGIGISKGDLPNIFDRFYRADESRTRATGGYGLGLPMARIITLGHKGSITVRSKVNEGTEFGVKIPIGVS